MNTKTNPFPSLTDNPQYAAAAAKLVELQENFNAVDARFTVVLSALNHAVANSSRRVDAIEAAAHRLIGNDVAASPDADASRLREELAELTEKKQVFAAAVRLQREVVANLRNKASKDCIAQVLPTHREMVRNIIACLVALDAAQAPERELRENLLKGDISLGELRPMPVPHLGRLSDADSRMAAYVIECFEFGIIGINEVPKHLRSLALTKTSKWVAPVKAAATVEQDGWGS